MAEFKSYIDQTGEIGFVERVFQSIVYVKGLPGAKLQETVIFESGEIGHVIALNDEYVEVLVLTGSFIRVGTRVARTGEHFQIRLGEGLLGQSINAIGNSYSGISSSKNLKDKRPVDINPPSILNRKNITHQFFTGITWIDLIIPIGQGQRELIIGDRKIGKTDFLIQVLNAAAKTGTICVYAAVAKRSMDIKDIIDYLKKEGIEKKTVVVASSASDAAGLIFLTPYTAMTIAEYFRDLGHDVLLILDDMTAHAKYYREISLLAKRFPGRSSYPGDIFYVQSRLLERAGNFVHSIKKADGTIERRESSITCLPVAELILGDMSGYIQTNLMAVTDGHILFDRDLYNQGRRPAINPFLSVTRVGHQTQSEILKDASSEITSFLVHYEKVKQYIHFGAELSEATRRVLALGDQVVALLQQSSEMIVPANISLILLASLWAGHWKNQKTDKTSRQKFDAIIDKSKKFQDLVSTIRSDQDLLAVISNSQK
jgi:F-type H+-transporting ATPase subunit alpha